MGARFADLAGSSLRDHAVQQHGRLHLHAQDLALHPQLMPAAQAAEVGLIVGPVQVQDGYSVFRVLGRTPDRIDPFDAVQDRVTALLVQQQQQERLSAMLDRLRARHSSVIEIHAEALQAAIPDYLLGR